MSTTIIASESIHGYIEKNIIELNLFLQKGHFFEGFVLVQFSDNWFNLKFSEI
jgi:hypothetical protein